MWALTNLQIEESENIHLISYPKYTFFTDEILPDPLSEHGAWICDGYLLSRKDISALYSSLSSVALAEAVFLEYGHRFIDHIKGHFTLIQLMRDTFRIYSDHFGIKKYFWWKKNGQFIISNDLKAISKLTGLKPSSFGMAAYALTYHFTGGLTAFENVRHNQPAECVSLKDGILTSEKYWHPEDLLEIDRKQISIKEISASLKNATLSTLNSSEPISLSLTGGADTRNLLSIFLSMGVSPHLYTYGNPRSNDCMKAAAIAEGLGLEHQIHDITMTAENFEDMARKIIRHGGGLASIHRAHRLLAVEMEMQFAEQMYLGTLGGEFIKGVSEDDYIVPAIVYDNWNEASIRPERLDGYLERKRLIASEGLKERLLSHLRAAPYMNGDVVERKHQALCHITAHLHDAQDINLYETVMQKVYTPFLDMDYLQTLFASQYTFNNKEAIPNPYVRRAWNPVYGSQFIQATHPPLLRFRYSGEHKPSEVLVNKYLAALLKGFRQKWGKGYPPNFPLGDWMVAFVKKNLPVCNDYPEIREVFDLETLMRDLENDQHRPNEGYWLKFTNPIMMRFLVEEFCHA
jgi:asparagine synthetase B (glutamine-hydrolysing)